MTPSPSDTALQAAALALREARAQRRPIAPVSASHGIAGLEAAYAVAEINTRARLASGRRIVGKKVGLTSKAVQQQLGVDQPDFGMLFDDMELLDGQDVPIARLLQPKVEAEVAFVVGRDLAGPAPSWAEFLACLAYALPAIEIVDSAIADWKITLVDQHGPANARASSGGETRIIRAAYGRLAIYSQWARESLASWLELEAEVGHRLCIKTGALPECDVEIGARSVTVCHLGNLAYWHNTKMKWDPQAWKFVDGQGDNKWLDYDRRGPNQLPTI